MVTYTHLLSIDALILIPPLQLLFLYCSGVFGFYFCKVKKISKTKFLYECMNTMIAGGIGCDTRGTSLNLA